MSSLGKIIRDDRHPLWLVDAIILSAVVYATDPAEELKLMDKDYGLPPSARYEFVSDEELRRNGFAGCHQTLLVVRSLTGGHVIVACRGTMDVSDALVDFNFIHRTMSLGAGAAHAGFLDRAKSIPMEYFRRLLVRGERVVLTGHSLGGAVASLLTLRLLEATGNWCHEQIQCYTFGCPFFADSQLASYINKLYKHHFVHIVSRNDIVPKVMPLAYTLYSMWHGLQVGPWGDLVYISRLFVLATQIIKPRFRIRPESLPLVAIATQAATYVPGLLRFVIHRALALALSHQSGYGYAFSGHMVLLDPETSALEYADTDRWTVEHHLSFHFGIASMDAVKEHSLLSYIDNVFAVQSTEMTAGMAAAGAKTERDIIHPPNPKVEVATISMKWFNKQPKSVKQMCLMEAEASSSSSTRLATTTFTRKKRKAVPGLRSRVACLIFARRLSEASPTFVHKVHKRKPFTRFVMINLGRLAEFAHRFDAFFFISSAVCAAVQLKKFLLKSKE